MSIMSLKSLRIGQSRSSRSSSIGQMIMSNTPSKHMPSSSSSSSSSDCGKGEGAGSGWAAGSDRQEPCNNRVQLGKGWYDIGRTLWKRRSPHLLDYGEERSFLYVRYVQRLFKDSLLSISNIFKKLRFFFLCDSKNSKNLTQHHFFNCKCDTKI